MKLHIFILTSFFNFSLYAQTQDSIKEEEEDYSQYANAEVIAETSTPQYCTPKVLGLAPAKLISIGYDYQLSHHLTSGAVNSKLINEEASKINSTSGLRLSANIPIVSNTKWLFSLGANYWDINYDFKNTTTHPFSSTLKAKGLQTAGINTTIFKPLNGVHFILAQASFDWSSDMTFKNNFVSDAMRFSGAAIFGWKKHDRRQFGIGLSRTYRAGEVNILPIILYNYTYPNKKWGYELLIPARGAVRYTASARNIIMFGYELEGNTFYLDNLSSIKDKNNAFYLSEKNINLRRSELRFRFTYDFSIYKFLWLSVQAGYRIGYLYNVDEGEFFRGFTGDQPYLIENKLAPAPYFNVSLNLVSP